MARMYETYKLKITNDEGIKDVRVNKNVDCTSYKQMISFYKECKKRNENNSCTIDFVGVTATGEENIMFSKTYCQEVNQDKELLRSTDSIVGEIKHLLGLLERKKDYHNEMQSVLDKRQDVALHNVEECGKLTDKEKLKLLNSLEIIRKDRRFNKNELKKIRVVYKIIDIEKTNELFDKIIIPIDEKKYTFLDEKQLEEKEIIKEIKFNSDKDRIHKMKQVQGKFNKITVDHANKKIICWNKSKK